MAFPPAFLEELRARLPLSEVIGKRLRLVRAGREFQAPCPFHNEKTPSFTVNDQKGFFHCFGCGAHGDVVGFVMRFDHLAFLEAVETLANAAGLAMPRTAPEERQRYERQKSLHEVVEAATGWFESQLRSPAGLGALNYLQRRGLDEATIAAFRLGYAPAEGGALRLALERAGFTIADMLEAGLVKRPADGTRAPFSFFRHRVMFPVADRRGRIVAFGGRLMDKSAGGGEGPKYINTGETPLFHKGELLYGLSRARQAAADNKPVIVVEGYMDVIALVRAGWPGAVAPLGTALTESQVLALWQAIPGRDKYPLLCFDGDNAGKRAAWRAVDRILPLLAPDQSVRVAYLPAGEDPDSLIRARGPGAMQAVLEAALPLEQVLWEIETTGRNFDSPEAKAGLEAALTARVGQIADRAVQRRYDAEMKRRLREAFWSKPAASTARTKQRPGSGPSWNKAYKPLTAGPPPRPPKTAAHRWQRMVLAAVINHPALAEEYHELLAMAEFAAPELNALRRAVIDTASCQPANDSAALCGQLEEQGFGPVLADLLSEATYVFAGFAAATAPTEDARRGLAEGAARLRKPEIRHELQIAERSLLGNATANPARLEALRQELAALDHIFDDGDR